MTTTTHDLATVSNEVLKTDCKGRIRFPAHMRERLLDEYERSGMSGAEFAAFYNIKYTTFASWRQRRERKKKRDAEGYGFVEVHMTEVKESEGLKIDLPGGANARITTAAEARLAGELLKAYSSC